MHQFDPHNKYFNKFYLLLITLVFLINLLSCRLLKFEYPLNEQYGMARSRIEGMKEQLNFSFKFEKESVHVGEPILFIAQFTNNTNSPIEFRIPQQTGIRDMKVPNTTLEYSINSIDKSIAFCTPLSCFGMPYVLMNPIQASEFETIKPYATMDVVLELPNKVSIQTEKENLESKLPIGRYVIILVYDNLYIGYQFNKGEEIWFVDLHAWVGRMEAQPVILTVLP